MRDLILMRNSLLLVIAALFSLPAWSESCSIQPLLSKDVDYKQGSDLAVIVGPFQFNLPEKPSSLIAFDGAMAAYPNKEYVSYQLISDESVAGTLSMFTTRKISAAALNRYLYGIDPTDNLNTDDKKLIQVMRTDLKLDCQSNVERYRVGTEVDVLLQGSAGRDPEHRLLFFSKDSTHLISVKGSRKKALAILHSIKARSF